MENPLGKKLHQFRRDAGLKQTVVANLVHCSPDSISRIESGERLPGVTLLGRILQVYGDKDYLGWMPSELDAYREEFAELLLKAQKNNIPTEKATQTLEGESHGLTGVKSVYKELDREFLRLNLRKAKNTICVLNTWLWSTDPIMWGALENAGKQGVNIQILLLDPKSNVAKQRLADLGYSNTFVDTSHGLRKIKSVIKSGKLPADKLAVRLYTALPPFALYVADDWGLMGTFWHGRPSFDGPHIELDIKASLLGAYAMETYTILWNSASPYKVKTHV